MFSNVRDQDALKTYILLVMTHIFLKEKGKK